MTYLSDWLFVVKTFFTVMFVDCPTLERRLRFMEDMADEKRKRELPYRLVKFMYQSILK